MGRRSRGGIDRRAGGSGERAYIWVILAGNGVRGLEDRGLGDGRISRRGERRLPRQRREQYPVPVEDGISARDLRVKQHEVPPRRWRQSTLWI